MNPLEQQMRELVEAYSSGDPNTASNKAILLAREYPNQPLPFNILGAIAIAEGEHQAAIEYLRKALAIEPRYPDALNNLGAALHTVGQYEEAVNCYVQLLRLTGDDAEIYSKLGNALWAVDRLEEAELAYNRAITLKPDLIEAHLELAKISLANRDFDQALTHFRRCLEVDSNSAKAHWGIGQVLESKQRSHEALRWYQQALDLDPDNPLPILSSARVLLQLGKLREAVPLLERHLELLPGHGEATHLLAAAKGSTPATAPKDYISKLFDGYASDFERHLTQDLGYAGPAMLYALLERHAGNTSYQRMLDLGCGSGLAGEQFASLCDEITGIDLSPKMVGKAEQKGVYSELVEGDITEVMPTLEGVFDLITCADTLVYIGDLRVMARQVAKRAAPSAILLLTTEASEIDGFQLLVNGRYAHHRNYVETTFAQVGFSLVEVSRKPLRMEAGNWIEGEYFLFSYSGDSISSSRAAP